MFLKDNKKIKTRGQKGFSSSIPPGRILQTSYFLLYNMQSECVLFCPEDRLRHEWNNSLRFHKPFERLGDIFSPSSRDQIDLWDNCVFYMYNTQETVTMRISLVINKQKKLGIIISNVYEHHCAARQDGMKCYEWSVATANARSGTFLGKSYYRRLGHIRRLTINNGKTL